MKCWSEPTVELLVLSPSDVIQSSGGNDPYELEYEDWKIGSSVTLRES